MQRDSGSRFAAITCGACGRRERTCLCAEPSCGRRFVPIPGGTVTRCPLHDPALLDPRVPEDFRLYRLARSRRCPRCDARLLPDDVLRGST